MTRTRDISSARIFALRGPVRPAALLSAVLMLGACDSGFIPTEPPILRSVSGIVTVPAGDQDRFVDNGFSASRMFASLLGREAHAEIFGLAPIVGATVQLVRLDESGNVIEVIGTTTTNASGAYGFTDSPGVASTIAVQVLDDSDNPALRAIVTGRTVDISPASEVVVRSIIDDIVRTEGTALSNFDVQEISALSSLVAGMDIDVRNMDTDQAINAIRNGSMPLLAEVAQGFSSPGVVSTLHNALYGGVDFVPVLIEPSAAGSSDGGIELRTETAAWGFDDLNIIAGGQLFGLRTRHDLANTRPPFSFPEGNQDSPAWQAAASMAGIQHIVTSEGKLLVGDAASSAVVGAATADGGLLIYPRAVTENNGSALGRGIRIAARRGEGASILDHTALDPSGTGTDYHLVRLRQTLSGPLGNGGENSIAVAAETGTVRFDTSDPVTGTGSTNALYGMSSIGAISSDRLLVDLDGAFTLTDPAAQTDPIDAGFLVVLDGTTMMFRRNGTFYGQGYVANRGDVVSLQTTSNLLQIPLNVLANDIDPDAGDTLIISAVTPATLDGVVTVSASGQQLLYTPVEGAAGPQTLNYTVSDGTNSATGNVTFNVTTLNTPPSAVDDSFTVAARSQNNLLDVLANDREPDLGQRLTVVALNTNNTQFNNSGSTATIIGSGPGNRIRYVPGANHTGQVSFTYTVRDDAGSTASATVTVTTTIAGENRPPVPEDDAFTVGVDQAAVVLDVLANDRDPDLVVGTSPSQEQTLLVSSVSSPASAGGVIELQDGVLRYTPPAAFAGTETFTYTVTDGELEAEAAVTITVRAAGNTPPVAVADAFRVAVDDVPRLLDVLANDSDTDLGDTLSIGEVQSPTPSGATVTIAGGMLEYAPFPGFAGEDSFSYTVSDGAAVATAVVTVTVSEDNAVPEPANDEFRIAEGSANIALDVLANDRDLDLGDSLVITSVASPGTAGGTVTVDGSVLRYTPPAADFSGLDTFTYTVSDGTETAQAEVRVIVDNGNVAPIANDDITWTVLAGSSNNVLTVLANDSDPNGDAITINGTTQPNAGGDLGTITPGTTTELIYTPAPGFTGSETFAYTITDGRGGQATATVVVSVIDPLVPNTPPRALPDDFRVRTNSTNNPLAVLANDSDPDAGDELTIIATGAASAGGTVTIDGGVLRYAPLNGFAGTDRFTYTVRDSRGAEATAAVTVLVSGTNAVPVATDDFYRVGLNTVSVLEVLANDFDPDIGTSLIITAVSTPSAGGDARIMVAGGAPNTRLQYLPAENFRGTETFTYTISDGTASATATVTIEVAGGNTAPLAVDDSFSVVRNSVDIFLDVLRNDSDPDVGDAPTVTAVGAANNGTVQIAANGSGVTYTPDADFAGSDSFTYAVTDGRGLTDSATVTVTVTETNTAPQPVDDEEWNLVLPANEENWAINVAQREVGVAIRKSTGLFEDDITGTYNLVQHAGYLFADGTGAFLGTAYDYGTLEFSGNGAITSGVLYGKRSTLDVELAREGNPAALLIVPLSATPPSASGTYDVGADGTITMTLQVGDGTVITGKGAVTGNGEVIALAVRIEENGSDSGRGLMFLVRQP